MTLTELQKLKIEELSAVSDPANEIPGWLVIKSRGLVTDDGSLTPDGADVVIKALAEGKIEPADVLSDDELATVQKMQPRPFIENFGAVRAPGAGDDFHRWSC